MFGKKKKQAARDGIEADVDQSASGGPDEAVESGGDDAVATENGKLDFLAPEEEVEEYLPLSKHAPEDRALNGPYDITEVERGEGEVDFGSIVLPVLPDLDIRMEVEENGGRVLSINFDDHGSSLQVQAFAAPKSEGLWLDLREQIASTASTQGGTIHPVEGTFGEELVVSMPAKTADGQDAVRAARFVGVDGPRWFLRGVFSGPAAIHRDHAQELEKVFRSIAVVRGDGPMPPKDLLPLTVPDMGQDEGSEEQRPPAQDEGPLAGGAPARGPETTQIG